MSAFLIRRGDKAISHGTESLAFRVETPGIGGARCRAGIDFAIAEVLSRVAAERAFIEARRAVARPPYAAGNAGKRNRRRFSLGE